MPDNIFSGIPSLNDDTGLQTYLNNQQLTNLGIPNTEVETSAQGQQSVVQPTTQPGQSAQPAVQPTVQEQPTLQGAGYTVEDVNRILARNAELEKQVNAMARPTTPTTFTPTRTPVTTPTPRYSANQINLIKQALDQGATIEQIQAALSRNTVQNGANKELLDKVNAIENYLQQSAYDKAQTEFINKLTDFGDKFGLSENDLVVFGNTALAKGINIAQVSDLESVFRAIYPEQYAIRVQRMQHTPTSQIFGGSTMFINPTAMSEQAADNYVEGFLKGAMPNQYRKK